MIRGDLVLGLAFNRRRMALPLGARCSDCGTGNPLVLFRRGDRIVCYGCETRRRGRSGRETHHIGGRGPRVPVDVTDAREHRIATYLQESWRRSETDAGSATAVMADLIAL